MSRRDGLATGFELGTATPRRAAGRPTAVVVGGGAFGGWTALHLQRRGVDVTLVDAWPPGHSRSSSGGETRVLRASYGERGVYTKLVARAVELWRSHDKARGTHLFHPCGVLWMHGDDDAFRRASLANLEACAVEHELFEPREGARRWPQIRWDGVRGALWEPRAGFLLARRACADVAEAFDSEGGRRFLGTARPAIAGGRGHVELADGRRLDADRIVFACGPWLPTIFPELLGDKIRVTRQEVFFFGTPAAESRFEPPAMPVWADRTTERFYYGIPGNEGRGFKVADDTRGPAFDPTTGDREPSHEGLARVRDFLAERFPELASAPLVEARVCQYENSPDGDLLFDRHPEAENLWILGGGSGHGFKLGPALGEHVAAALVGEAPPEPAFALRRLRPTADR